MKRAGLQTWAPCRFGRGDRYATLRYSLITPLSALVQIHQQVPGLLRHPGARRVAGGAQHVDPVAVAAVDPPVRTGSVVGAADRLGLGRHEGLGHRLDHRPQRIGLTCPDLLGQPDGSRCFSGCGMLRAAVPVPPDRCCCWIQRSLRIGTQEHHIGEVRWTAAQVESHLVSVCRWPRTSLVCCVSGRCSARLATDARGGQLSGVDGEGARFGVGGLEGSAPLGRAAPPATSAWRPKVPRRVTLNTTRPFVGRT